MSVTHVLGELVTDQPLEESQLESRGLAYPFAQDRLLLTCGLAAVLLFWAAVEDHSDGFYTFLRVYVCGLSVVWAIAFHSIDKPAWALGALCSAILFNPVFTVDLDRETWQVIDFFAGALYSWLALQTYAAFKGKPWIPYAPAGLLLGVALLSEVDLDRSYGTAYDETMNVDETLTTNEVLTADVPNIDLRDVLGVQPADNALEAADNALEAAANAVNDAANAVDNSDAVDYSGDWRNMRPNGTRAETPSRPEAVQGADQSELDRIFNSPLPARDDPRQPQSNSVWANELEPRD